MEVRDPRALMYQLWRYEPLIRTANFLTFKIPKVTNSNHDIVRTAKTHVPRKCGKRQATPEPCPIQDHNNNTKAKKVKQVKKKQEKQKASSKRRLISDDEEGVEEVIRRRPKRRKRIKIIEDDDLENDYDIEARIINTWKAEEISEPVAVQPAALGDVSNFATEIHISLPVMDKQPVTEIEVQPPTFTNADMVLELKPLTRSASTETIPFTELYQTSLTRSMSTETLPFSDEEEAMRTEVVARAETPAEVGSTTSPAHSVEDLPHSQTPAAPEMPDTSPLVADHHRLQLRRNELLDTQLRCQNDIVKAENDSISLNMEKHKLRDDKILIYGRLADNNVLLREKENEKQTAVKELADLTEYANSISFELYLEQVEEINNTDAETKRKVELLKNELRELQQTIISVEGELDRLISRERKNGQRFAEVETLLKRHAAELHDTEKDLEAVEKELRDLEESSQLSSNSTAEASTIRTTSEAVAQLSRSPLHQTREQTSIETAIAVSSTLFNHPATAPSPDSASSPSTQVPRLITVKKEANVVYSNTAKALSSLFASSVVTEPVVKLDTVHKEIELPKDLEEALESFANSITGILPSEKDEFLRHREQYCSLTSIPLRESLEEHYPVLQRKSITYANVLFSKLWGAYEDRLTKFCLTDTQLVQAISSPQPPRQQPTPPSELAQIRHHPYQRTTPPDQVPQKKVATPAQTYAQMRSHVSRQASQQQMLAQTHIQQQIPQQAQMYMQRNPSLQQPEIPYHHQQISVFFPSGAQLSPISPGHPTSTVIQYAQPTSTSVPYSQPTQLQGSPPVSNQGDYAQPGRQQPHQQIMCLDQQYHPTGPHLGQQHPPNCQQQVSPAVSFTANQVSHAQLGRLQSKRCQQYNPNLLQQPSALRQQQQPNSLQQVSPKFTLYGPQTGQTSQTFSNPQHSLQTMATHHESQQSTRCPYISQNAPVVTSNYSTFGLPPTQQPVGPGSVSYTQFAQQSPNSPYQGYEFQYPANLFQNASQRCATQHPRQMAAQESHGTGHSEGRASELPCSVCGHSAIQICSRCNVIPYCSTQCQTYDWPSHRLHCATSTKPSSPLFTYRE